MCYGNDKGLMGWSENEILGFSFQFLMVSLPELSNGTRYWLEIGHGDSACKTGGIRAWLPTRDCPQISSLVKKKKNLICDFFILFFFSKEVRNATEAHTALIRDSPYVPRTLQMQLMRINICRVLRRWNQFICWK